MSSSLFDNFLKLFVALDTSLSLCLYFQIEDEAKEETEEIQKSVIEETKESKSIDPSPSTPDKPRSTVSSHDTEPSVPNEQSSTGGLQTAQSTPKTNKPAAFRKKVLFVKFSIYYLKLIYSSCQILSNQIQQSCISKMSIIL
jgi:hypothetical protein